jgi:molybdenum cofactor synthesis domain-containing protein
LSNLIKAVVVTASDTRSEIDDISGQRLVEMLHGINAKVVEKLIVSDDYDDLRLALSTICDDERVNLIITTGGTGFAERDNTPEATLAVIDKETPGISEAIRFETAKNTKFAMLSRGVSGIKNKTLIINLPGSTKGVEECFNVIKDILPHSIRLISGDTGH